MQLKIKLPNGIIIVDILTLLLILVINFTAINSLRVILGLPFVLLFPGYVLAAALFPEKKKIGAIERWTISLGMSLAVVALIGLGLNYSPWGITVDSLLSFTSAFIMVMSVVAIIRSRPAEMITEYQFNLLGRESGFWSRSFTFIFIVTLVGALGVLLYTVAVPRLGERFTEFYYLGLEHRAEVYPVEFQMQNGRVVGVRYSEQNLVTNDAFGKVTLGVVNREQQTVSYSVEIRIVSQPVSINNAGQSVSIIGPINLQQGVKWEQEIGFAPTHTGDHQKVEFLLYQDGGTTPARTLILWIDVKQAQ